MPQTVRLCLSEENGEGARGNLKQYLVLRLQPQTQWTCLISILGNWNGVLPLVVSDTSWILDTTLVVAAGLSLCSYLSSARHSSWTLRSRFCKIRKVR
jgi:hypothetical protein